MFLTLGSSVWKRYLKIWDTPENRMSLCCVLVAQKNAPRSAQNWSHPGRTGGRGRQVQMLPALFPRKQILSQENSRQVLIQCLFSTCTLPSLSVLKPGSSEDLEQHSQYSTILICLFCHYPMNALTFQHFCCIMATQNCWCHLKLVLSN